MNIHSNPIHNSQEMEKPKCDYLVGTGFFLGQ